MVRLRLAAVLAAATLLAACGDPCADGTMVDGPGALVVVPAEHPDAWGRTDCFTCHSAAALHLDGCYEDLDVDALQDRIAAEGEAACGACHGTLGVEP